MTKKLIVSASLLAKSQVAAYTRKDGTMVQSHDNGRQAAAPQKLGVGSTVKVTGKTTKEGGVGQIKQSQGEHHIVKFQDGSSYLYHHSDLSAHADAEQASAKPLPSHVQKMVSDVAQSSAKPEHKKAAIDAIVSQHAGGAAEPKPAAGGRQAPAPGEVGHEEHQQYGVHFKKGDKVKDRYGKSHEVLSHTGAEVKTVSGESFHPTKLFHADTKPAPKLAVRASVTKKTAAKTGSAAPAKMKNVGTDKWPLHAKTSDALGAKHPDGSTHHIGGFEPPTHGKGDHLIHHDGKTFSYSGKSGKNMKTGEASYEYRAGDSGEHRAWVTHSGHLMND